MTKTILSTLFISAILFTGAIAASVDLTQFAEAAKGAGVPLLKVGSSGSTVCGDRLCSEYPGGYEQFKKDQGQGSKIGAEAISPKIAEEAVVEEAEEEAEAAEDVTEEVTVEEELSIGGAS